MCYLQVSKADSEMVSSSSTSFTEPCSVCSFQTNTTKRKVQFGDIEFIPTPSPLNELFDWTNVWYQPHDLDQFRSEARVICRQLRTDADAVPQLARDFQSRGLEARSCLERQRRKFLSNRCVVRAFHHKCYNEEQIAALSRRCTAWASELAVEEGNRDYVRAYCCAGDDDEVVFAASTNHHKRLSKQQQEEEEDSPRRVRPRIMT